MIAGHDQPTATPAAGTATMSNAVVREMIARWARLDAFSEPNQKWTVLAADPDLIDLPIDAAVKIPECLPAEDPFALEVVRDPEADDPGEEFAILVTRREPAAVRPAIESLDRVWLVDTARPIGLPFDVGVDCA